LMRCPALSVRAKADTGRGTAFAARPSAWGLPERGDREAFGDFGLINSV
jgi:hypothetical protein